MNKFLIRIALASCIGLVFYVSLILATDLSYFSESTRFKIPLLTGINGNQWTRLREADTTKNVDVLIVGSSLAQSIDVRRFRQFDLRAFNLGSGSQSPIQTKYLLKKYLDDFNPKLVIWDFHPYTFSGYGIESTVDIISNCNDCSGMLPMIAQTNSMLAVNTYVKRLLQKPFEESDFKEPLQTEFVKYISGGYIETSFNPPSKVIEEEAFTWVGLDKQKRIFEQELNRLTEKGISVLLVYSPKSEEFNSKFQNKEEWLEYAQNIKAKGLAEDFLDFNQKLPDFQYNPAYFFDFAHLTAEGAAIYNNTLINTLSDRLTTPN